MLDNPLRRVRGSGLTLGLGAPTPARERRPCDVRPAPGATGGTTEDGRGRFSAATQALGPDSAELRLGGELDYAALDALDEALGGVERAILTVLVDMADVTFIDLGSLARLAAAHARLEASGGGLLVVYPPRSMLRLLARVEGLDVPVLR